MRTLGIDPGSITTGYGMIEQQNNAFVTLVFGVVRLNAKASFPHRLKKLYDELAVLIEQHRPTRLALETAFYGKNAQSALKLGQVRGAIQVLAMNYGLEVLEYSPREVKKSLTGTGNASKEQVAFMVRKLLNLSTTGEFLDASDALGLALCDAFKHHALLESEMHALRDVRLQTQKRRYSSWKSFIDANPHLLRS